MKTAVALVALVALVPGAMAADYVGGGTVFNPTGVGFNSVGVIICQSPPSPLPLPFGIGGVCALDCSGAEDTCLVTNTNGNDAYRVCWDTNGDGIKDTCTPVGTGTHDTGGFKGPDLPGAFVLIGGTTGTITALDP